MLSVQRSAAPTRAKCAGPSVFYFSVSGGPSRLRGGGRAGVLKNKKQKTRGGPGLSPPSGSRKYAQGGQGGGAGKQHQVRAGRMALRVGFEQGFPGLDHYWCRHTSPHEVSGAQCLSRRLILAVFQLVFVFRLGGPTPSEAAGGRPLTEKSKTDGPVHARGARRADRVLLL